MRAMDQHDADAFVALPSVAANPAWLILRWPRLDPFRDRVISFGAPVIDDRGDGYATIPVLDARPVRVGGVREHKMLAKFGAQFNNEVILCPQSAAIRFSA